MRALFAASLGALALASCASGGHYGYGPSGIPYLCGDGSPARIVYRGGGYYPRGSAQLHYQGRAIDLIAAPPTYGLRYESSGAEQVLIWSARGEEAWLHQRGANLDERELAHCTRVREPGGPEAVIAEPHGEGGGHH